MLKVNVHEISKGSVRDSLKAKIIAKSREEEYCPAFGNWEKVRERQMS